MLVKRWSEFMQFARLPDVTRHESTRKIIELVV